MFSWQQESRSSVFTGVMHGGWNNLRQLIPMKELRSHMNSIFQLILLLWSSYASWNAGTVFALLLLNYPISPPSHSQIVAQVSDCEHVLVTASTGALGWCTLYDLSVPQGVHQGCVFSPILFWLYKDDLLKELADLGGRVLFGQTFACWCSGRCGQRYSPGSKEDYVNLW